MEEINYEALKSCLFKFLRENLKINVWYDEIGYGVNTELPDITMEFSVDACYEMIIKLHEQKLL